MRDVDPAVARENLARLFKQPVERLEKLFSGERVVIKRGLDEATAQKYRDALRQAGAICALVSHDPNSAAEKPAPKMPPAKTGKEDLAALSEPVKVQFKPQVVATAEPVTPEAGATDALLAAPGAVLVAPEKRRPPTIDTDHLHLVEVGALLGDARRVDSPDIDISALEMDAAGAQLDEPEDVEPPAFALDGYAIDQPGVQIVARLEVEEPDIDVSALSVADPESPFEQPPKPVAPEFDLSGLALAEEPEPQV